MYICGERHKLAMGGPGEVRRRQFQQLAPAPRVAAVSRVAAAQTYPATAGAHGGRFLRQPGDRHPGAPDSAIAGEQLSQQFIVENRPGAGGT